MQGRHRCRDGRRQDDVRLVVLAAILSIGCKSSAPDAATRCAEAARKGSDAMLARAQERLATSKLPDGVRARMEERTRQLEVLAPRLAAVLANRCIDDRWSADVIACIASASDMDAQRSCRANLPAEHQAKLQQEELALLAGEMGPPSFGSAIRAPSPEVKQLERELATLNEQLAAAAKSGDHAAVQQLQREMQDVNDRLAKARAGGVLEP